MKNTYTYRMSRKILEMSSKPIRNKEEAILLLLYTIRMFDVSEYINEIDDRSEKITITVNKMNRIFYSLNNKIFSMQFPFSIREEEGVTMVYSTVTGTQINAQCLSFLIEAFERMNKDNSTFDTLFEIIMESELEGEDFSDSQKWLLISYLLKCDLGYLRSDYDPKNENGKFHPLNHLDIFLDPASTFKLGVKKRMTIEEFTNLLDITTECSFIANGER